MVSFLSSLLSSFSSSSVVAPPSYVIYLALFMVQLLFVLWFFVAKYAMAQEENFPPLVFAAYREVVATMMFLGLVVCSGGVVGSSSTTTTGGGGGSGDNSNNITVQELKRHTKTFLLLGFLLFANVAGFIVGLSMVTSFNAAVLQPTQPVFASLIAWMLRYETMSRMKIASIGMACSGAALTVWLSSMSSTVSGGAGDVLFEDSLLLQQQPPTTTQNVTFTTDGEHQDNEGGGGEDEILNPSLGNIILLFQCMCSGAMVVIQKRLLYEIPSPILVTAISYTVASICTVMLTIVTSDGGLFDPVLYVTSFVAWMAILYAALFATVFTYYTMAWANQWANPSTVTLSLCLQPLLTAFFTAMSGGPPLVPPQILSCGLIIAGLCIKVYDQEKQQQVAKGKDTAATSTTTNIHTTTTSTMETIELPSLSKEVQPLVTS